MTNSDLLKLSFASNFHNKKCVQFLLTSFGKGKYVCVIKTVEIFSFLPLGNSSVNISLNFLLY